MLNFEKRRSKLLNLPLFQPFGVNFKKVYCNDITFLRIAFVSILCRRDESENLCMEKFRTCLPWIKNNKYHKLGKFSGLLKRLNSVVTAYYYDTITKFRQF